MQNPLVSISCTTYNHEPYIRQCLDGFLMQQCDFEYEILVHDDASTDGTQKIIKEYQGKYPEIIKPIFQTENQYSKGIRGLIARFNLPRARGKYIALCEGDDYWIDPLKLKKQVDFLERNEDYVLTTGGFILKNEKLSEEEIQIFDSESATETNPEGFDLTLEMFFKKWYTKTLTLVFRKNSIDIQNLISYINSRDLHINYFLLKKGKGYAQQLMDKMLAIQNEYPQIDRIELEVNDLNQKAKGFYKNYGFEQIKKSQDILVLSKSVNQVNRN